MSLPTLSNLRDQQATSLAYFDAIGCFAVLSIMLIGLIFLMRPSVAEKGAAIGAE